MLYNQIKYYWVIYYQTVALELYIQKYKYMVVQNKYTFNVYSYNFIFGNRGVAIFLRVL